MSPCVKKFCAEFRLGLYSSSSSTGGGRRSSSFKINGRAQADSSSKPSPKNSSHLVNIIASTINFSILSNQNIFVKKFYSFADNDKVVL